MFDGKLRHYKEDKETLSCIHCSLTFENLHIFEDHMKDDHCGKCALVAQTATAVDFQSGLLRS